MAVYGYTRVSTREQAEKGLSLDAQASRIDGWAIATGRKVDGYFADGGVSASSVSLLDRPASRKMLNVVKPGDTIVVTSLDRMFRSIADAAKYRQTFTDTNVSLIILDLGGLDLKSAAGGFMFHVHASLAAWEGERKAERQKESNAKRREMGLWGAGRHAPIGLTFRVVDTRIGRRLRLDLHPVMWPVVQGIVADSKTWKRRDRRRTLDRYLADLRKRHPLLISHRTNIGNTFRPAWRLYDKEILWQKDRIWDVIKRYEDRLAAASSHWEFVTGVEDKGLVGVHDGIDRHGWWPTKAPRVVRLPLISPGKYRDWQPKPAPAWVLERRLREKEGRTA